MSCLNQKVKGQLAWKQTGTRRREAKGEKVLWGCVHGEHYWAGSFDYESLAEIKSKVDGSVVGGERERPDDQPLLVLVCFFSFNIFEILIFLEYPAFELQ